jgi:hypothetical protein
LPTGIEEEPPAVEEPPTGLEERPPGLEEEPPGLEEEPTGLEEEPPACEELPTGGEEPPPEPSAAAECSILATLGYQRPLAHNTRLEVERVKT